MKETGYLRAVSALGLLAALAMVAFVGAVAWAAPLAGRDMAKEEGFARSLDQIESGLGAKFHHATNAMDAGKLDESRAEFLEVVAMAPAHAPSLWRLSGLARAKGERDEAIVQARRAVDAEPVWQAKLSLAEALELSPANERDLEEASRLLVDVKRKHNAAETTMARLQLAIKRNDVVALGQEVRVLESQAPTLFATYYFKAIWLASTDELGAAGEALEKAVALGLAKAEADSFAKESGIDAHVKRWRYAKLGGYVLAVWLVGLAFLFVAGRALSQRVLTAIENAAGNPELLERTTRGFRRVYGWLIGAGAAYFYFSIPIVITVVVLCSGGIIMAFVALGHIPIKLTILVAVGALISIWSMLKSLIVKRGPEKLPGRELNEAEAPELWRVLREVAARVNTRAVDAVFVLPGTDIAVIETGGMAKRLRDEGRRSLLLGVGVVSGMTVEQFSAILAHEYGHFSNRDTARGDVALVVQASLFNSAVGMARGGGASWINPAWLFITGFHGMYARITLGASRLQEVMADQFAAMAFGAESFATGFSHVIRRSIEFSRSVDGLVKSAETSRRPIANLYAPFVTDAANETQPSIDTAFAEALTDPGSPFDSHPPPHKRIEWVRRMAASGTGAATSIDAGTTAWSLFADRAALESEMTNEANGKLIQQGIVDDPNLPESFKPLAMAATVEGG